MSASTTTGNSRPLALCTVIRRTPSLPSSTIGASVASPRSAASRSASTKPRNDRPSLRSYWRASSATCSTLASTCSPPRRSAKPAWARVRARAAGHGLGHRPAVALRVQPRQQPQRLADRGQVRAADPAATRNGCRRAAVAVAILEQRLVADGEERAAQRGEHRQLVVGPLDRPPARRAASRSPRGRGRRGRRPARAGCRALRARRRRRASRRCRS